jgi:hypothetical protein
VSREGKKYHFWKGGYTVFGPKYWPLVFSQVVGSFMVLDGGYGTNQKGNGAVLA